MADLQTWRGLVADLTWRERFILLASAAGVVSVLVLFALLMVPPPDPMLESGLSSDPADPLMSAEPALMKGATPSGFEIFEAPDWAKSAADERIGYQRALEADLARSIEDFDGVASARVHLVLPRESLFADNAKAGKASVLLRPRSDALSTETKDSISILVAGAVEGIDPGAVAIVTTGSATGGTMRAAVPPSAQPDLAGSGSSSDDGVNSALAWFREHPNAARYLALAALLGFVYFALLRPIRRQVMQTLRRVASENEDIGGSFANSTLPLGSEAERFGGRPRSWTDRRLSDAVTADPQKAARLVQSWVNEAEAGS